MCFDTSVFIPSGLRHPMCGPSKLQHNATSMERHLFSPRYTSVNNNSSSCAQRTATQSGGIYLLLINEASVESKTCLARSLSFHSVLEGEHWKQEEEWGETSAYSRTGLSLERFWALFAESDGLSPGLAVWESTAGNRVWGVDLWQRDLINILYQVLASQADSHSSK
jgi:hypothetical protein